MVFSVGETPVVLATLGSRVPSPRSGSIPSVVADEDSQLRMLVSPDEIGFGAAEISTLGSSGSAVTVIAALADREPYSLVAMMTYIVSSVGETPVELATFISWLPSPWLIYTL